MNKFGVIHVPLQVEYPSPVFGRLFGVLAWLILVKVKKINVMLGEKPVGSFYRLIVPRFVKGGVSDEKC